MAIALPIAIATSLVMVFVVNVFFDGLYALDPITRQLGPEMTLLLYVLAWVAVVSLIVWLLRRRILSS